MQQEFIEYVLLTKLQAARVYMQDQYLFHYTLGGQDTHNASEHEIEKSQSQEELSDRSFWKCFTSQIWGLDRMSSSALQ